MDTKRHAAIVLDVQISDGPNRIALQLVRTPDGYSVRWTEGARVRVLVERWALSDAHRLLYRLARSAPGGCTTIFLQTPKLQAEDRATLARWRESPR